ncbi:MAG: molybdopterin-dependent oxidoreductase [Candidatus Hodarchaeota archaeon]
MDENQIVKSTCGLCFSGCGVLVHITDGKVIKVKGDPDSPVNNGVLCSKGLATLEYLYHPDRLRHPLKRIGKRGRGEWQHISWDEALDRVADELNRAKEEHGAESVAFVQGTAKGLIDTYNERLANAFGSPNLATSGHVCFLPRLFASKVTCGFYPVPDYQGSPACIIVWGANLAWTRLGEHLKTVKQFQKGTQLIVIDPLPIKLTKRAHLWLKVRPGTDLALALGMIHVIIEERLYNQDFVNKWTVGFDQLEEHVQEYTPEKVAELIWVPDETIRRAARTYATNKPASIQWGNAIDHGINSFQTARAINILRAITGNLDIYGGDLEPIYPLIGVGSSKVTLWNRLTTEIWRKRVSADNHLIPLFHRVLPQSLIKAILKKDPYPIRAMFIHASNPLLTFSNAQETYRALKQLDFIVLTDRFMTPTASLADIILPTATFLEFDSIVAPPYYPIAQVQQKVLEVDECWSDYKIVNELSKRLGIQKYFWENIEDFFDLILKPSALTFKELRKVGVILGIRQDKKYETGGFKTPSGKIELYSNQLKEWGFDALPIYIEPPETPYNDPELVKEFPLLFTNFKSAFYRHSDGRQIRSLRDRHLEPIVFIHPETASNLDIQEEDWVYIETKRGRIKQKAVLSQEIDPRVIGVDFGWWFPEKGSSALYDWVSSNINILTNDKPPYNREMGSSQFRGVLCKVYSAK